MKSQYAHTYIDICMLYPHCNKCGKKQRGKVAMDGVYTLLLLTNKSIDKRHLSTDIPTDCDRASYATLHE